MKRNNGSGTSPTTTVPPKSGFILNLELTSGHHPYKIVTHSRRGWILILDKTLTSSHHFLD